MKNYICINCQKIELTEEQVARICAAQGQWGVKLADIPEGDTFKIGDCEFIVLEHSGDTAAIIRKELLSEGTEFAEKGNNYDGSYVDEKCQEFAQELAEIVGWDSIVLHKVDLTSDDGLKDYGEIERRASCLTAEMYRKFVEILDKFMPDRWWWLATAHSTERHGNDNWAKCVAPSGSINNIYCNNDNGVRPFCILKSNIFVSK